MNPTVFYSLHTAIARPTGLPRGLLLAVGLLAVAALLTEHGFVVAVAVTPWIQLAETLLAGVYLLDRVLLLARGPNRWALMRQRQFEFAVLVLFATLALGLASSSTAAASVVRFLHQHDTRDLWLDLLRLFLLANVLVQILRSQQRLLSLGLRPEWMLAGSFGMLILAGTLLLSLPRASAVPERPVRLLEAFFTATSASCVTGLSLRDIGTDLTPFGQAILLALFQVGGLGIMTFVAFLAVTAAESLPVPQMLAFRQLLSLA